MRRTLFIVAVAASLSAPLASPAGAGDAPATPRPGLGELIDLVVNKGLIREAPPSPQREVTTTPGSPFGNPSQRGGTEDDRVRITAVADFTVNLGEAFDLVNPSSPSVGTDVLRFGPDRVLDGDALLGTGNTDGIPARPDSDILDPPHDVVELDGPVAELIIPDGWPLPGAYRDLGDTAGLDDVIFFPGPDAAVPDEPVRIIVTHTAGGLVAGCGDNIFDLNTAVARPGGSRFPQSFDGDLFAQSTDNIVFGLDGCVPRVENHHFDGSGFTVMPSGAVGFAADLPTGESVVVKLIPRSEIGDAEGMRQAFFSTPFTGTAFTPETTTASSWPPSPALDSPSGVTIVPDPFPDLAAGPIVTELTFEGVTLPDPGCGPDQWSDTFEIFLDAPPGPEVPAGTHQVRSGQRMRGTFTYDEQGRLVVEGGGDGYTEMLEIGGGTGMYHYRPGELECDFTVTIDVDLDLLGGLYTAPDATDGGQPVTPEPPVVDVPDDNGTAQEPASAPGTDDDGGDTGTDDGAGGVPIVPIVLIGTGTVATATGVAVRRRGKGDDGAAGSRVDPNDDNFLYEALAGLGGGGATTLETRDMDHLWTLAEGPELRAQDRIARTQAEIVRQWSDWYGRFKAAALRFAQAYLGAWRGSEELRANQDDWRVNQVAAKAIDLAFAVVQLVRGAFMLGRGIAGWWRARSAARMAARSADEIAALRAAADELLDGSPELVSFVESLGAGAGRAGLKSYRDEVVEMIMWGQDAGVDVVKIITGKLDEFADMPVGRFRKLDVIREAVITQVAAAAGLIEATPAVANAVENCAGVLGTLAREGGQLTDEGAAAVRAFVNMVDETPGFWDDAGNMFVRLARGTDAQLTGEIADLANGSTLSALRSLYDAAKASGGDLGKLGGLFRDALGPARATAMANAGGPLPAIPGVLVQDGAIKATRGGADAAASSGPDAGPAQVGAVGSLDAHMHQFGITGDSFLGNMWDVVSSPVETISGIGHSWVALDEINDLFDDNADDLSEMAGAWTQMVNALGGLQNVATGGASGRNPVDELQDALDDLGRARAGFEELWEGAPGDWKQSNRARRDEKLAHIDKKSAAIRRLIDGLRRLQASARSMHDRLDGLQTTPDGDRRMPLEWIDPELSAAVSQVAFQLEGMNFAILAGE